MIMTDVVIDGGALTVEEVVAVARREIGARLGDGVHARMETSRSVVLKALSVGPRWQPPTTWVFVVF